ncbi:MAG: hypothetical protein FWE75_20490 [Actinomycetia bacterium]|nr:hypothetical protein [Actinomycetes bacterium]
MPGATKAMVVGTAATLVMVVAYSVAERSDPWLWFAWTVLLLCTAGVIALRFPR